MRKADLKRSNVTKFSMSIGKSFQTLGAAWLNARHAVTVLVGCDCSSNELDERSCSVGTYSTTDDAKYAWKPVCRTLYAIVDTLKSIMYLIGYHG